MTTKNWVNEVLADATKAVDAWPSWMRSYQVRTSESLMPPSRNGNQATQLTLSTKNENVANDLMTTPGQGGDS